MGYYGDIFEISLGYPNAILEKCYQNQSVDKIFTISDEIGIFCGSFIPNESPKLGILLS